jgi:hypothetical protein
MHRMSLISAGSSTYFMHFIQYCIEPGTVFDLALTVKDARIHLTNKAASHEEQGYKSFILGIVFSARIYIQLVFVLKQTENAYF